MLILNDLAQTWAADRQLRRNALRWTWFQSAFQTALEMGQRGNTLVGHPNPARLVKAFLDWAHSVESQASWQVLDQIDFLHFTSGLLLQNLLTARPPILEYVTPANTPQQDADRPLWSQGILHTGFVLTLLQALRMHEGASPLVLDSTGMTAAYWSGMRENVAEDSNTSIAFLDQMCGLQADWQTPSLISSRPAMQRALKSR